MVHHITVHPLSPPSKLFQLSTQLIQHALTPQPLFPMSFGALKKKIIGDRGEREKERVRKQPTNQPSSDQRKTSLSCQCLWMTILLLCFSLDFEYSPIPFSFTSSCPTPRFLAHAVYCKTVWCKSDVQSKEKEMVNLVKRDRQWKTSDRKVNKGDRFLSLFSVCTCSWQSVIPVPLPPENSPWFCTVSNSQQKTPGHQQLEVSVLTIYTHNFVVVIVVPMRDDT